MHANTAGNVGDYGEDSGHAHYIKALPIAHIVPELDLENGTISPAPKPSLLCTIALAFIGC